MQTGRHRRDEEEEEEHGDVPLLALAAHAEEAHHQAEQQELDHRPRDVRRSDRAQPQQEDRQVDEPGDVHGPGRQRRARAPSRYAPGRRRSRPGRGAGPASSRRRAGRGSLSGNGSATSSARAPSRSFFSRANASGAGCGRAAAAELRAQCPRTAPGVPSLGGVAGGHAAPMPLVSKRTSSDRRRR